MVLAGLWLAGPVSALADPCCQAGSCIDIDPAACSAGGGIVGYCHPGSACGAASCDAANIQAIVGVRCVKAGLGQDVSCVFTADPAANAYDALYVLDRTDIPVSTADQPVPGSKPTNIAEALHAGAAPGPGGTVFYYKIEGRCLGVTDPGWVTVKQSPSLQILDMKLFANGRDGFAVGGLSLFTGESLSTVLRTSDGGQSWQEVLLPDPTVTGLNGLAFVTPLLGWVVGDRGVIYQTADGGDTWTAQRSGTTRNLTEVSFVDAQHGWACGDGAGGSYLILHTADGGQTWVDRSFTPGGYGAQDIEFWDTQTGWVSVRDSSVAPHVYRTTDGGQSWVEAASLPAGMASFEDMDFVSATEGFATGYSNPSGIIARTIDGGVTWTQTSATNAYWTLALDCEDASNCGAIGFDLGSATARLFITRNGGMNWTSRLLPANTYVMAMQMVGEMVWAGADYSQIWRTTDAGFNWSLDYSAPLWGAVAWRDATTAWTVAGSYGHTDGYAETTVDGGQSWSRDTSMPGGWNAKFVDALSGYSCYQGNRPPLATTSDGGALWTSRIAPGGGTWMEGCLFATPTRGWAYGSNGKVVRTDDGGSSWSPPLAFGSTLVVSSLNFLTPMLGFGVAGAGGSGYLATTVDGGDTWRELTPPADFYRVVHFLDDQYGLVGATGGRIYRTLDGGQNWAAVADFARYDTADIYIHDRQNAWVVVHDQLTDGGRAFIHRTDNGGAAWTLEWSSPWIDNPILDLAPSVDRRTLWAVGENATILRRSLP